MGRFNRLPEEIKLYILTRLPTDSVLDCKLVCKTWRNLVTHNPLFTKMHLHNLNHPPSSTDADSGKVLSFMALSGIDELHYFHYFEINDDKNHDHSTTTTPIQRITRVNIKLPNENRMLFMIGCCNGLICIGRASVYSEPKPYICNPITKEFLKLPEINIDYCDSKYDMVYMHWGFGYVSSTDKYKVVGIHWLKEEEGFVQLHVYTLGSGNGWRNLGKFNFESSSQVWSRSISVNGVVYWLTEPRGMIVAFDLAEEKFCEHISPPPLQSNHSFSFDRLGVLDGLLFLGVCVQGYIDYDIWLLKRNKNDTHDMKEQKEHKSWVWSKDLRIDGCSKLFAVTKTGDVLTSNHYSLNIYDPKASTLKKLVDLKGWINQVLPHKNTFVSLKELGEEETDIMQSIEVDEEIQSNDHPLKHLAIGG